MIVRARAGLIATLAAGALTCAACGGDSTPRAEPNTPTPSASETTASPTPTGSQPPSSSVQVAIIDNSYDPAEVTVAVGGTVLWQHAGTATHSVTAKDNSFDSSPQCSQTRFDQCLQTGAAFSHVFNTAGRFEYSCRIHGPLMAGVVVVA